VKKMKNNRLFLLTLIVGISFLLIFSSVGLAQTRFGLAISTLNNPFFVTLRDGAQMKADELGVELIIVDAQNDASRQLNSIEDMIVRQIDILMINPVDAEAIVTAIESANQAGIPVITVDRGASGGEVVSHIASDNAEGGRMAARYMVEQLNEEGTIIELEGIPGTSAARDRGMGFNEVIDEYMDVEIVAKQPAGFDRAEGMEVMENLLQANPDVDAVFAHNDSMALGAIEAIEAAGMLDQIMVVGFDAIDDAKEAVREGTLAATIAQKPDEMGMIAVETANRIMEGETVDEFIPVPLKLVTMENVDE
jgi:ribose transport system substrate-binding protein